MVQAERQPDSRYHQTQASLCGDGHGNLQGETLLPVVGHQPVCCDRHNHHCPNLADYHPDCLHSLAWMDSGLHQHRGGRTDLCQCQKAWCVTSTVGKYDVIVTLKNGLTLEDDVNVTGYGNVSLNNLKITSSDEKKLEKNLPEIISDYLHSKGISKYNNLRKFYSSLLDDFGEDIKA